MDLGFEMSNYMIFGFVLLIITATLFTLLYYLLFFLSLVSKTQPNHWTKRMANTQLTT